jgi:hypothetical protein
MAYGNPRTDAGVEAYFTDIRGGRPPSPEALDELRGRYRAVGGSPLEEITRRQAAALSTELGLPTFVGMKHAPPFIAEAAAEAAARGIQKLIGLTLAPHYAGMSLGQYEHALREAWPGELDFVPGFHDHPAFIRAVRGLLTEALEGFQPERLFFTGKSPVRGPLALATLRPPEQRPRVAARPQAHGRRGGGVVVCFSCQPRVAGSTVSNRYALTRFLADSWSDTTNRPVHQTVGSDQQPGPNSRDVAL